MARSPVLLRASPASMSNATAVRSSTRQAVGGPPQEVGRRRHVAAGERPSARRRQPFGRADPEIDPVLVERPELGQVAVGLLEVVAEDLLELELAVPIRVDRVGPRRRSARGATRAPA